MRAGLESLAGVSALRRGSALAVATDARPAWRLAELAGRLVEVSGARANGSLSAVFRLVLDAQRRAEHVAWIGARASSFHPPDVAECGIDLEALVVVRVPHASDLALAADWIARSGAFGLIVLDLTARVELPLAQQSRLLALAQKHDTALVCLTEKSREVASLSSLVSLRGEAVLRRTGRDVFECELAVLKDKRRSRAWRDVEVRRGTPGLR